MATAKISRVGNSLALRISKGVADSLHIYDGSIVSLSLENHALVVRPKRYTFDLDDLVDAMTSQNMHSEWVSGHSVGAEF